jgi:hypothetical protein
MSAMNNTNINQYLPVAFIALIVGLIIGFYTARLFPNESTSVKVWAIDKTVSVPNGLREYLESKTSECDNWKGTNSQNGVAVYAIERSTDNYAVMAYGCSDRLSPNITIAATHAGGDWLLIPPTEYYGGGGGTVPLCSETDKYHIAKSVEPKCEDASGAEHDNTNS